MLRLRRLQGLPFVGGLAAALVWLYFRMTPANAAKAASDSNAADAAGGEAAASSAEGAAPVVGEPPAVADAASAAPAPANPNETV